MAETKKVSVQAEERPEQTAKQETEYAVSELIAASDQLFSCPRECTVVALKQAGKENMSVSEAQTLIEKFMKKEVK